MIKVRALLDTLDLSRVIGDRLELRKQGREYVGLCPFHDDHTPSLNVIPHKRFAHCFSCGWNGNAIDFLMQFHGIGFKAAARTVVRDYSSEGSVLEANGTAYEAPPVKAKAEGDLYHSEVPARNMPRPAMRTKMGPPVAVWEYRTAKGIIQGYVARYNDRKRKVILCWSWGVDFPERPEQNAQPSSPSWHCRHFSRPRPLYGLELLAQHPDLTVVVVEGEKTADAARVLFEGKAIVVTWPGGCPGIKHADWRPLEGRNVVLIPDADEPGKQAMAWLGEQMTAEKPVDYVRRVDDLRTAVPEDSRPAGWDLADVAWEQPAALAWFEDRVSQWASSELQQFRGKDPDTISAAVPKPAEGLDEPADDNRPFAPDSAYEVDLSQLDEAPRYSKPAGRPLNWEDLSKVRPPERDWAITHWLGMGHVTLLAGPGGAGKSLISQTIASAIAIANPYIGDIDKPRRVLYWACEDDHDELWRRQVAIADYFKTPLRKFTNLIIVPRLGENNGMLEITHEGLAWCKPMAELQQMIVDNGIDVLFLDTVAQACPDEINRHVVTTFCNKFAGLRPGLATVLIAHPSRQVGSEYSGSTAWEASVRMRWFLGNKLPAEVLGPEEEDEDTELRWLCKRKTNYSSRDYVKLRYENGVFVPEFVTDQGYVSSAMREVAAAIVLKAIDDINGMGKCSTDAPNSPEYLPGQIMKFHMQQNCTRKMLEEAMRELMKLGKVKKAVAGTYDNRKPRLGLVIVR